MLMQVIYRSELGPQCLVGTTEGVVTSRRGPIYPALRNRLRFRRKRNGIWNETRNDERHANYKTASHQSLEQIFSWFQGGRDFQHCISPSAAQRSTFDLKLKGSGSYIVKVQGRRDLSSMSLFSWCIHGWEFLDDSRQSFAHCIARKHVYVHGSMAQQRQLANTPWGRQTRDESNDDTGVTQITIGI
jgi:hypothetical protein